MIPEVVVNFSTPVQEGNKEPVEKLEENIQLQLDLKTSQAKEPEHIPNGGEEDPNLEYEEDGGKLEEFNFEDYHILTQIGEGSFGKIYLVEDKDKNIFSMKKIIANDEVELESFTQEYELVNQSRHKNILKIVGICRRQLDFTTFVLYILMEVGLNDWEKEIKSRQLTKQHYKEEELLQVLKQMCSALLFLQNKNISHRDIKPQNILLFKNGIYKVADFGEAKQISKFETNKQLCTLRGTELYMSPLLFNALRTNQNDIKHNAFKSDVFSLAFCILYAATLSIQVIYECRKMYDTPSIMILLNRVLKQRFSPGFINILGKMLEINESKRFDFIQLSEALKELEK
jgi:serine/threonine protein kinase